MDAFVCKWEWAADYRRSEWYPARTRYARVHSPYPGDVLSAGHGVPEQHTAYNDPKACYFLQMYIFYLLGTLIELWASHAKCRCLRMSRGWARRYRRRTLAYAIFAPSY